MLDLKNCPFCGGEAISGPTFDNLFYAMCADDKCGGMAAYFPTEAEAIAAWNRRALQAVGPEPAAWRCDGCGRLAKDPDEDLKSLRGAGRISCCPERDMLPLYAALVATPPVVTTPGQFAERVVAACRAYMNTYDVLAEEVREHMQISMANALRASDAITNTSPPPPAEPAEPAVAYIQPEVLDALLKDKTATGTVCSGLLKRPFNDPVPLYTKLALSGREVAEPDCKHGGKHGPWTRTYMGSSCGTCGYFTED